MGFQDDNSISFVIYVSVIIFATVYYFTYAKSRQYFSVEEKFIFILQIIKCKFPYLEFDIIVFLLLFLYATSSFIPTIYLLPNMTVNERNRELARKGHLVSGANRSPLKHQNFEGLFILGSNVTSQIFSRRSTASSINLKGSASSKIIPLQEKSAELGDSDKYVDSEMQGDCGKSLDQILAIATEDDNGVAVNREDKYRLSI
jgi:hypothetical protein